MRTLILILCLLTLRVEAQTVTGAAVETNGWVLDIYITYTGTNGAFNFGLNTNRYWNTTASNVSMTVTSLGFSASRATNTVLRQLYVAKQLRLPYPNQTINDVTQIGSSVLIRAALSSWVFTTDSNLVLSVAANTYSNNTAIAGLVVTNGSTWAASSMIPVANWAQPQDQHITNTTWNLRAACYSWSGRNSRSVAAITFLMWDAHGHTNTQTVTQPISDKSGAVPMEVWQATMQLGTFTAGDTLNSDFICYPWIGDTVMQASASGFAYAAKSSQPTTNTWLYDPSNTYAGAYAVVQSGGSDSTGVAVSQVFWATNTAPAAFATIEGAATAIAGTNNLLYLHNDVGGGTIYLQAGSYNWTGGTGSYGTNARTYITVAAFPGLATNQVFIGDSVTGDKQIGHLVHLYGLTITNSQLICFDTIDRLWIDHCVWNTTGDASLYRVYDVWLWDSYLQMTSVNYGFKAYSVGDKYHQMLVGNTITSTNGGLAWLMLGNRFIYSPGKISSWACDLSSYIAVTCQQDYTIVADNLVDWPENGGADSWWFRAGKYYGIGTGAAFVGNCVNGLGGFGGGTISSTATLGIMPDSDAGHSTNVLMMYNTSTAGKANSYYTEYTTNMWRNGCAVVGNLFEDWNIKSDTFAGSTNGTMIGNWSVLWSVGCYNNAWTETTNCGAPGSFVSESQGLNSYQQPTSNSPPATTVPLNSTAFIAFVNRTNIAAGGNLRLQSSSPFASAFGTVSAKAFDLDGNARGAYDPPGAYCATPQRGNAFLTQ